MGPATHPAEKHGGPPCCLPPTCTLCIDTIMPKFMITFNLFMRMNNNIRVQLCALVGDFLLLFCVWLCVYCNAVVMGCDLEPLPQEMSLLWYNLLLGEGFVLYWVYVAIQHSVFAVYTIVYRGGCMYIEAPLTLWLVLWRRDVPLLVHWCRRGYLCVRCI